MDIKFEVIKKIAEARFKYKDIGKISQLDSTSPPSVFIGSKLKYPLVNVGIISPVEKDEEAWIYDDAKYWANNQFGISDVIRLRGNLLNSRFQSKVQDSRTNNKFVQIAQEIAIASRPVDVQIELNKGISVGNKLDKVETPHGISASLKNAKISGNVKVERKLDKLMNDEVKSSEALISLYKSSFSEYSLNKILSVGVLGLKKNKRLVPTKWSITATDDTLTKSLLKEIKTFKIIENYELFFGEFLGNQYLIMLFPSVWSYELFEIYFPGSSWNPSKELKASTDYEDFYGRKEYASSTAGGYYASRFPIVEYLHGIRRQASVLAVRLETPSYWAALGVWVVRESVRKALTKVMKFSNQKEMLIGVKEIALKKYNFDASQILPKSKILESLKTQRKLNEFF